MYLSFLTEPVQWYKNGAILNGLSEGIYISDNYLWFQKNASTEKIDGYYNCVIQNSKGLGVSGVIHLSTNFEETIEGLKPRMVGGMLTVIEKRI